MQPLMISIIGFSAAVLGAISWLPQAVKVWRTRDTSNLSLLANAMFLVNVILWLTYGMLTADLPIILANLIGTAVMIAIVAAKLKFG